MSKQAKGFNPFYPVLVLVGILFTLTACSYFVMAMRADKDPATALREIESGQGFVAMMDRYGVTMMAVELAVLAVATVAAMGTDEYWQRRGKSLPNASVSTKTKVDADMSS